MPDKKQIEDRKGKEMEQFLKKIRLFVFDRGSNF